MAFNSKWLKSPKRERNLERLIGKGGTIRYHIKQSPFQGILDSEYGDTFTYRVKSTRHSPAIKKWINTVIRHVDPIINVDFKKVGNPDNAELIFMSVKHVSDPWSKSTTGENLWNPDGGPGQKGVAYVLSKNSKSARDQKETISHELGHALGLKHPQDKPNSPDFSTATTIMSYNTAKHENFPYIDFTINDLNALVDLWGKEPKGQAEVKTRIPFPAETQCKIETPTLLNPSLNRQPTDFFTEGNDLLVANNARGANEYGDSGDDTVLGSTGNDTLGGGDGNDYLDGGPGRDQLYGHDGKDRFHINQGEGVDIIHDFEMGKDVVQISHQAATLGLKKNGRDVTIMADNQPIGIVKDMPTAGCFRPLEVIDNQFIV